MSYAIIRNEKYTRANLTGLYRHNERRNTSYTNKNIHHDRTHLNYSLKTCNTTYLKKFDEIQKEKNLKGYIRKNSNVVCEYLITSDEEFFKSIGKDETLRYFQTAYNFVKNYKNLGEDYIISATVHMDETTPHMHLLYIPVVHKLDTKSGKNIDKICCSEFWKGRDSYKNLQNDFYSYIKENEFDLERGLTRGNKHINIEKLKQITNYETQELFKDTKHLETEIITNDIELIKQDYRRIIRKFNTIAKRYSRIKTIVDETNYETQKTKEENIELHKENEKLKYENSLLQNFIDKTFDCVSIMFNFPKESLKRIVKNFVDKFKSS